MKGPSRCTPTHREAAKGSAAKHVPKALQLSSIVARSLVIKVGRKEVVPRSASALTAEEKGAVPEVRTTLASVLKSRPMKPFT
jgi:hypothetical protein